MSKKALGSIPTFEKVAESTTNSIKNDLDDLFKEDAKEEINLDKNKDKEDLKKSILAEAGKQREEAKKEINKTSRKTEKEIIKELKEAEERPLEETNNDAKEKKPSTKLGLRAGYKRQTFVIREDLLEMIQALSNIDKEVSQANILEALIETGLKDISEDKKEKALASYRSEKQLSKEEKAKNKVDKLFN